MEKQPATSMKTIAIIAPSIFLSIRVTIHEVACSCNCNISTKATNDFLDGREVYIQYKHVTGAGYYMCTLSNTRFYMHMHG